MARTPKSEPHLLTAHVLFMDVVGYSKLLVNEQRELLQQLNQIVRKTAQFRKSDASGKLICLPSGDGMALVFFQSPEEPVQCALEISKLLKFQPRLGLRMGVHSGPVDQIKDFNDRSNVAGAGINIAQRVMDCGDAGHILLSKRVAEDLAQDSLWRPHLHELGEIEVKHGVKVGLVNLYTEELGNPDPPEKFARPQTAPPRSSVVSESPSAAPEKSIAVLPFENLSADPENAFFADGVQDEILTNLARIADLKVISRSSVMQYRTPMRNLREIASILGVAHILEGNVQRAGNRVRVSAQLIDARTDAHLWAENYHRPLDDVFAIQTEVAKAVADQLQAKLSPAEKAAIEQPPTANLVAYDRYLRGKKVVATLTYPQPENLRQAVRLLDQAVAFDPTFLLAYCQLAWVHTVFFFSGVDHSQTRVALAKEALGNALRLGPERGESHLAAAWIYYQCYRDYATALEELVMAQRALPNDPSVFELIGYITRRRGEWDQCIKNLERACELDPRNVWIFQQTAGSYQMLRRYPEAVRILDRALSAVPEDANTRIARALVDLESQADTETAYTAIHAVLAEDPSAVDAIAEQWFYFALCRRDPDEMTRALASVPPEGIIPTNVRLTRHFCEGLAARTRGDASAADLGFNAARLEVEKLVQEQPDYAEALCLLGMINAALGRKDEAIAQGRKAIELFPITKDAITGAELSIKFAIIYAWTGETDRALEQLEEVLQVPGPISYGELRLHPWWDPLRDDPRFEKLVAASQKPVALA